MKRFPKQGFITPFQWWLGSERAPGSRTWSAWGWGGQFIVIVPWLDAVAVTTQGNYEGLQGLDPDRLLEVLEAAVLAAEH